MDDEVDDCGRLLVIFNYQFSIINLLGAAEAAEEPTAYGTTAAVAAAEEEFLFLWHVAACADILPYGGGYAGGRGLAS